MLAQRHRLDGGGEVGVVRRANANGIEVFPHLIEHLAKVVEALRIGIACEILSDVFWKLKVDITECDGSCNSSFAQARDHPACTASYSDAPEIDPLAGRELWVAFSPRTGEVGRNKGKAESGGG